MGAPDRGGGGPDALHWEGKSSTGAEGEVERVQEREGEPEGVREGMRVRGSASVQVGTQRRRGTHTRRPLWGETNGTYGGCEGAGGHEPEILTRRA